jgi:hypothetical protein
MRELFQNRIPTVAIGDIRKIIAQIFQPESPLCSFPLMTLFAMSA